MSDDLLENIRKAIEKVRDHKPEPHRHVVHPDALTKDGVYLCSCGPLRVKNGEVARSERLGQ